VEAAASAMKTEIFLGRNLFVTEVSAMNAADEKIKILLVEDNMDPARLLMTTLNGITDSRFEFTQVQYLKEALKKVDEEKNDIVLLDLMLPDSQGFDTFMKMQPYTAKVPIVILTGMDDSFYALKAIQDGAQDYVVKYETNTGLLSRVIRHAIERHQLLKKVSSLSLLDELTGLYNRRGFFLFADQHLKLTERGENEFYLIFADLDDLKLINDAFGHYEGDAALKTVSQLLKSSFRGSDTIARMGGDEFAILTLQGSKTNPKDILLRLENKIKEHHNSHPRAYHLSLSIGIARYRLGDHLSIDELLSEADSAMYEEKKRKKEESKNNNSFPGQNRIIA
jgi:diguanylate cyclase (GGDEF)-like protein